VLLSFGINYITMTMLQSWQTKLDLLRTFLLYLVCVNLFEGIYLFIINDFIFKIYV